MQVYDSEDAERYVMNEVRLRLPVQI